MSGRSARWTYRGAIGCIVACRFAAITRAHGLPGASLARILDDCRGNSRAERA